MSDTAAPFGRVDCDLPGFPGVWVQFKTSGYPHRLRREWIDAGPDETLSIVLRYVTAWQVVDVDGAPVELPPAGRAAGLLDNVEDALVVWLIRAFRDFWLVTLTNPRPNSSAPSPAT